MWNAWVTDQRSGGDGRLLGDVTYDTARNVVRAIGQVRPAHKPGRIWMLCPQQLHRSKLSTVFACCADRWLYVSARPSVWCYELLHADVSPGGVPKY